MQEPFGSVERTLNYARFLGQTYVYKNFGELAFPDNTELTFWNPGDSMSVHSDNSWQEDAPDHVKDMEHPTNYRGYSVIFYLKMCKKLFYQETTIDSILFCFTILNKHIIDQGFRMSWS